MKEEKRNALDWNDEPQASYPYMQPEDAGGLQSVMPCV